MNYYIQGDAANADKIRAAFEKLGYNTRGLDFSYGFFYPIERDVHYCVYDYMVYIIKTHPDYQELPLTKPHYNIANFKPFDKVLVRQNDSCTWGVSFFGRCSGGMFMCCPNVWFEQCIPFEGNKHLLGTTDMCDERYINW